MSSASNATLPRLVLPSDQDSTGRTLGPEEVAAVTEAIATGTLTSTKGAFVKQLEEGFAKLVGASHCHASASGSGAIHTAVAAIDPEPGDEIVTTPITDMGAISAILYQSAIPVFADVDPQTYNVTAETIEKALSDRTKAIVVTHLFGNPCEMHDIMDLARDRQIPVIEDCAQSFLATYRGQQVGTIGDIGCFSLQQGKHITTGEGGLVVSNNADYARRMFLFINKAWGYGDAKPDHYFLAPNYRMNELTGAVAVAQLQKLPSIVDRRVTMAERFTAKIKDLHPGVATPLVKPDAYHTYWKYCLHVDETQFKGGADALGAKLREYGIACAPRYIQKPAFECQVIKDQRTFGNSRFPFNLARPEAVDYSRERFDGSWTALRRVLVLPWNECYEDKHIDYVASALQNAIADLV